MMDVAGLALIWPCGDGFALLACIVRLRLLFALDTQFSWHSNPEVLLSVLLCSEVSHRESVADC